MRVMMTHIFKDKILNAPIQKKRTRTWSDWPVFRSRLSRSQSADGEKRSAFPRHEAGLSGGKVRELYAHVSG